MSGGGSGKPDRAPRSPTATDCSIDGAPDGEDLGARSRSVVRRSLQGLGLSLGAPLGWLLLRLATGVGVREEVSSNPWLYAYMFVASAVAFVFFGAVGGRREERLEHLATTDSLTSLRNVRYFRQRLQEAVALARRGDGGIGLALLDIDRFKRVNDELGHAVGDRVLEAVGRAMAREARAGETAARIGGEELALILPGADLEATREAAERIRRAASSEVAESGVLPPSWRLTLSAGIAAAPARTRCFPEGLFSAADRALYRAKETGRDRVVEGKVPDRPPDRTGGSPPGGDGPATRGDGAPEHPPTYRGRGNRAAGFNPVAESPETGADHVDTPTLEPDPAVLPNRGARAPRREARTPPGAALPRLRSDLRSREFVPVPVVRLGGGLGSRELSSPGPSIEPAPEPRPDGEPARPTAEAVSGDSQAGVPRAGHEPRAPTSCE